MGCPLVIDQSHPKANPVTRRFAALSEGTADMSVYQFSVTKERQTKLSFSQPYTSDGVAILVAKSNPAQSLSALLQNAKADQIVVANNKTTGRAWASKNMGKDRKIVDANVIGDTGVCIRDGRCLSFVGDRATLSQVAAKKPWLRILEGGPYSREAWAIAFRRDNKDVYFLWQVNDALKKLEETGALPRLRAKWNMPSP